MARFRALTVALVLLAAAAFAAHDTASASGPQLVEIPIVVTDSGGAPVSDLTRDDFTLEEDGHPVALASFVAIDADRASSPDEGRVVVLLLGNSSPPIKSVARQIVDRMNERDSVAVLGITGHGSTRTTDKQTALADVERVGDSRAASGTTSGASPGPVQRDIDAARVEACRCTSSYVRPEPAVMPTASDSRRLRYAAAYRILRDISDLATPFPAMRRRRTSLVYIGDARAFNTPPHDRVVSSGSWFDAVRDASRADVTISIIDPSGTSEAGGALDLAGQTGGQAFVAAREFATAIDRVWQASGHYYLLGYTPVTANGRHTIDVHVNRPSISVRWRHIRG